MKYLKVIVSSIIVWMVIFPATSRAQEINGQQIIENVYNREEGDDRKGELTMTLRNASGNERVREIKQFEKKFDDMEKSIMFFISPADVRNTSFMSWSYDDATKDDDQWIYLPALGKVKRISSDSKDDYFMGSDFTYDDLGDRHPDEDEHTLLRTEELSGELCYVVESMPKDPDYMYSKTITWVIKDKWIGLQKQFFDTDGDELKTLTVKKHDQLNGIWVILHSVMHNVQKDHKTIMKYNNIEINQGISDNYFSERMMTRGL